MGQSMLMNNKELFLNISFLLLFIVGIILICQYSCWQTALGVFLLMWANNFGTIRKLNKNEN
jgi:hypothetical protein